MFNQWDIQGLRGVGNVELRFDPEHRVRVLFGSNGVGKTKCLEAIAQTLLLTNKNFIEEVGGNGTEPGWPVMSAVEVESGQILADPSSFYPLKNIASEKFRNSLHQSPIIFLGASGRSSIKENSNSVALIGAFSERKKNYFQSILNAITQKKMSTLGMADDVQAWFVSRAQSVNPYQKDTDNRKIEIDTVLQMLNAIDGRIDSKELQIDGSGRVGLRIDGEYRELQQLSSGFASLIKLTQAIVSGYACFTNESNLRHVAGVVLIDEIESHLHAEWQSKIIPILKAALPNTTFYIATHSPIVLSQLADGEAYRLARNDDGVVRSSKISSPNKRIFADVLESAFDVDLNALKRQGMESDDQSVAKKKLLDLINREEAG